MFDHIEHLDRRHLAHRMNRFQTEGLLSAAVQPPGSGSHLNLPTASHHHGTPPARDHNSEGQVNAGSSSIGDDSVGTDAVPESERTDASTRAQGEGVAQQEQDVMMFDEESEEDRLIAQGGIGIPIGPVRTILPRSGLRNAV